MIDRIFPWRASGAAAHSTVLMVAARVASAQMLAALPRTSVKRALAGLLVGSTGVLLFAWWAQHPPGLMSVDDSLYSMMAMRDWRALSEHGLAGLIDALTTSGAYAPLVPLLAAPLTASDPMSTATVLAHIPFVWLLIVSSYSIYRRFAGSRAAFIGTVVTVFLPGMLIYSRSLHFAVPLAAVLTGALAALLASRRLTSWRWALVFGCLIGLAPLTRTVAVAMAPGLVIAAIVLAARHTPARVWVPNLAIALAAGAVVAGPWYVANFSAVFDYLAANGIDDTSPFNAQTAPWILRLAQVIGQDVLIPLTIVGVGIIAVALTRRRFTRGEAAMAPVAITLAWYFMALASSRNVGTAFTLPLAPLLVVLVLYFASRLGRRQAAVAGATALAVAVFNLTAAVVPLGRVGVGDIADVGDIGVIDGRSATDAQLAQALGAPGATISDPTTLGSALRRLNCAIGGRGIEGPILLTRPDALVGGILHCAEAVYGTRPFLGSAGCSPTDSACVVEVIGHFGFPTVITGQSASPYPGTFAEAIVRPALTKYRMWSEIKMAPGVVIRIWARAVD